MRYWTFRKDALRHKLAGQILRFTAGKGYWLFGKPKPASDFLMFDSISITQIPADAKAVAGYVNGAWRTYPELLLAFPKAHVLSIAVFSSYDADCLDVEPRDATIDQAAAWVKRQKARGVHRPVVYTSVSQAKPLLDALAKAGIKRTDIRLWTAHYTFAPHRCSSKCGYGMPGVADATQFHDHYQGKNLDASLCAPDFFA